MEYTNLLLFALGLLGILIHTLVKIDKINRMSAGAFKLGPFIRLEWASLLLSFCVVVVALIAKQEVKKLDEAGAYLGLSFVAIGYMAQSLVYKILGKRERELLKESEAEKVTP